MKDATANKTLTAAAIDLGSNTFRLLIAGFDGDKRSVLVKRNLTVKLGRGLSARGAFTSGALGKGLAALGEFKAELDRYQPDCCRCCGTEALRRAANAGQFLAEAKKILGMEIEVLSGSAEALLSCRGVIASLDAKGLLFPLLVIDVGGSSTELIHLGESAGPPRSVSLPAGAVLFTELGRAGRLKRPFAIFQAGLRAFVKQHSGAAEKITIIATGGTAATMAMLDLGLAHYDEDRVHGHELTAEAIGAIAAELRATPVAARQFLPGLEEGRGDIILAGIEIYQEILATIEVDGMMISDSGLLEGIILSCLERGSL